MGHESRPSAVKYLVCGARRRLRIQMGLFIDFGRGRACASANENNNATRVKRAHESEDEPSSTPRATFKGRVSLPTHRSTYDNSWEQQSGGIMGWLLKQVEEYSSSLRVIIALFRAFPRQILTCVVNVECPRSHVFARTPRLGRIPFSSEAGTGSDITEKFR